MRNSILAKKINENTKQINKLAQSVQNDIVMMAEAGVIALLIDLIDNRGFTLREVRNYLSEYIWENEDRKDCVYELLKKVSE